MKKKLLVLSKKLAEVMGFQGIRDKLSSIRLIFQHGHDYEFQFKGTTVRFSISIPVRNYETFLRSEDIMTHCECRKKLDTKNVTFGLNGSGRTIVRPVQYCPKCDEEPLEYAHLCATINDRLIFV